MHCLDTGGKNLDRICLKCVNVFDPRVEWIVPTFPLYKILFHTTTLKHKSKRWASVWRVLRTWTSTCRGTYTVLYWKSITLTYNTWWCERVLCKVERLGQFIQLVGQRHSHTLNMSDQGFYLQCPSNASMDVFKKNTLSSYTNNFRQPLVLKGEYDVGLAEIHYPR
jgi:hypothetical protein